MLDLVKDYDLPEHRVREGNVNRFMAFCGTSSLEAIPPPAAFNTHDSLQVYHSSLFSQSASNWPDPMLPISSTDQNFSIHSLPCKL